MFKIFKKKNKFLVDPDEIFLDSKNLANFDRQQFEGRIERPISKQTILFLGCFFFLIIFIFYGRLGYLQIEKGEAYFERSENNTLQKEILFAERGIIYDRNSVELAWNEKGAGEELFPIRSYKSPGFSHILGYLGYPAMDKAGYWWQTEFIGKDGLEKQYNDKIRGENGLKIVENDVKGEVHSENIVNAPKRGENLVTTIDARLQGELFNSIKKLSESSSFTGGAGIIIDVTNGELLASTSFPEYNSEILSDGGDKEAIERYLTDSRKVFMDKTISGLYTPGSIVKPILALGALAEGVIDPYKQILSTGSISIQNPYFKDQETVFKDWKAHGWVDMREALAVSSDVYFYEIGGGFEGQKGLGILKIEEYSKLFGIGEKTGVDIPDESSGTIPSPEWKARIFAGDDWRVGDTYNTSIGQYGFQVTPMEMARTVSALANYGKLVTPHFVLGDKEKEEQARYITLPREYFDVVHEGMRGTVEYGTAMILDVPYVEVAAKTGTAQVGVSKNKINSWTTGFFPYQNPKYAFVVMMESGPSDNTAGANVAMRWLLDWMRDNAPEYFETSL